MILALLTALAVQTAVKAAVSQVTIYSDRARVVRTADLSVEGTTRAELPLLPDSVDTSSIRLEVSGASSSGLARGVEVQKLDIAHVEPDDFPLGEARELLGRLEKIDDQLALLADQQAELRQHLAAIRAIAPQVEDDSLKPRPKLNPRGWAEALGFAQDAEQSVKARLREAAQKSDDLRRERQPLAEKAMLIGGAVRRSGWRVTATLQGQGVAHLRLTYLVAQARWTPGYDLQLLPDQKTVRVSFSGAASQETGEDWEQAALTLSTAIPATVRALPEIYTWKIGEQERFIPTPWRADRPPPRPPPPAPPPPMQPLENPSDALRLQLLSRAEQMQPTAAAEPESGEDAVEGARAEGLLGGVVGDFLAKQTAAAPQALAAPPALAAAMRAKAMSAPASAPADRRRAEPVAAASANAAPPNASGQVGIAPPPSWRPTPMPPDSPAALAGGFDLEFASQRRETVKSGKGARRVLLFTETWPVTTERLLFPALSSEAYLVAQLKNPSRRTLPRGQAALSVGADPSGNATLPLVAPGQEVTLPLGLDPALRSFRNIAQVKRETGLFTKDDVTRYAVTIEVANPYPWPIPLRIVDQVPLQGDKNIEVEVIEAEGAEREEGTGKLTWRLTAKASGKVKLGFVYQLKRPRGYRVHQ